MIEALNQADNGNFLGTIEFFPGEGKYHYDGHRKCEVCWNPVQTLKHRELCPKCGKKVIERIGFSLGQVGLKKDKCSFCGTKINVVVD